MNLFIPFLMLFVPGLIAVRRHGVTKIDKENWQSVLFIFLVYTFLIIFMNNGVMFLSYPQRTVSFSPWASADSNIYSASFIFKYSLVALVCAYWLPELRIRWLNRKKQPKSRRPEIGDDE